MQKLLISTVLISTILISGVAYAADDEAHFIIGEKYGRLIFNSNVNDVYDNTHGNGILLGYDYGNNLALQLELVRRNGDISPLGGNGHYSEKTQALYLAYRSPGDFYFLIKGGYLWEQISLENNTATASASDSGLTAGIGAGYNFGKISLEAEYTRIEKNLGFTSVGFNFNF